VLIYAFFFKFLVFHLLNYCTFFLYFKKFRNVIHFILKISVIFYFNNIRVLVPFLYTNRCTFV